MAYQLYKKIGQYMGSKLKPTDISITQGSFGLGPVIGEECAKAGCVEIFLDKENNKIGLKATSNKVTGFTLQYKGHGKIAYVMIKALTEGLPNGRYPAVKENDMWVIDVPELSVKTNFD